MYLCTIINANINNKTNSDENKLQQKRNNESSLENV